MRTLHHNDCATINSWNSTKEKAYYGYIFSLKTSMIEDLEYLKQCNNKLFYYDTKLDLKMIENQKDFTNGFEDRFGNFHSLIGFIPKTARVDDKGYALDAVEWANTVVLSYGEKVVIDGDIFEVAKDEDDTKNLRIKFNWISKVKTK